MKTKIDFDDLYNVYNPVSKWLGKIIIDVYDMELETGEYSTNDALYHGIDQAKEELESEYEFTSPVNEDDLNVVLEQLFYSQL